MRRSGEYEVNILDVVIVLAILMAIGDEHYLLAAGLLLAWIGERSRGDTIRESKDSVSGSSDVREQ